VAAEPSAGSAVAAQADAGRRRLLIAVTVAILGGVALAQTAGLWWPGELASHWTLHGAVVAAVLAACGWRRPRVLALCLVGVVAGSWPWLLAWREPRAAVNGAGPTLSVAHANLYYGATRHAEVLGVLAAAGTELVCLIEAAPADHDLPELARWPHRVWSTHPVSQIALLSVHPIAWSVLHHDDQVVEALVLVHGRPLRVLATHPASPVTPDRAASRDRQLAVLARLAAASREPVLLLGDLNCTVASPTWRAFRATAGLRRPADPGGATWPSPLGPLGIAIDHLLVSDGLALDAVRVFAIPGSDHRGLTARVAFTSARTPSAGP